MAKYRISDPDGAVWEIEGPENATQADVVRAVTSSVDYKNAKTVKRYLSKEPNSTNTIPPVEGMPEITDKESESGKNTTAWLKANTKEPPYDRSYSDILRFGGEEIKRNLRRTYNQLKHSNEPDDVKKEYRRIEEEQIQRERAADPLTMDLEKLPLEKRLFGKIVPGLGTVATAAGAGTLAGGPFAGLGAGLASVLAMSGGAAEGERARLEAQGVSSDKAKQIGLLQGTAVPLAQTASMFGGPVLGGAGTPAAQILGDELSNILLQDQIHGPRTDEFPIRPYGQSLEDMMIGGGLGALGGASSFPGGRPRTPPALPGTLPGTRPSGPSPALPGAPKGRLDFEARQAEIAKQRNSLEKLLADTEPKPTKTEPTLADTLRAQVEAKHKAKKEAAVAEAKLSSPPSAGTSRGTKTKVKEPLVLTEEGHILGTAPKAPAKAKAPRKSRKKTEAPPLPPAAPNPFEPTFADSQPEGGNPFKDSAINIRDTEAPPITQDGRRATFAGRPDAANTDFPPPLPTWPGSTLPPELKDEFRTWSSNTYESAEDFENAMSPENIRDTEAFFLEQRTKEPASKGPSYADWLQSRFPDANERAYRQHPRNVSRTLDRYVKETGMERPVIAIPEEKPKGVFAPEAPMEGMAPLNLTRATATSPLTRQTIADRKPVRTLAPKDRVQESERYSRQQVADQNALIKKLTYAGYEERLPGIWVYNDGIKPKWEKNIKDLPERGITPEEDEVRKKNAQAAAKAEKKEAAKASAKKRGRKQVKKDPVPNDPNDVTSGNAMFEFPDHIEFVDRVWGMTAGGAFLPWVFNENLTPYKVNPERPFNVGTFFPIPDSAIERRLAEVLFGNVPWIYENLTTEEEESLLAIPNINWETFRTFFGPIFLKNGYDAISFVIDHGTGEHLSTMLISFDLSKATALPVPTAKIITAEKTAEYVRQLRDALWSKPDKPAKVSEEGLKTLQSVYDKTGELDAYYALDVVIAAGPSPAIRSLGRKIQQVMKTYMDAGFFTKIFIENSSGNNVGTFSINERAWTDKGVIRISKNKGGLTYRTLVHELIHAVTIPTLQILKENVTKDPVIAERYAQLKQEIAEFQVAVNRAIGAMDFDEDDQYFNAEVGRLKYSVSRFTDNIHEILAYGLTEPIFQRLLHKIPVKSGTGLEYMTSSVRKFHGIEENMDTLFFEAVKLFDAFADLAIAHVTQATIAEIPFTANPYHAIPTLRGPPDVDNLIGNHLNTLSEITIMTAGAAPRPYETGWSRLASVIGKRSVWAVQNGDELFNFLDNGTLPKVGNKKAPFFIVKAEKKDSWRYKEGKDINGEKYYLVDNTNYPPALLTLRKLAPEIFLDSREASLLFGGEAVSPTAVPPHLAEDETRTLLEMMPSSVKSLIPLQTKEKLKAVERWSNTSISEALEIWRRLPPEQRDLPRSYSFFNQLVSGSRTVAALTNNPLVRAAASRIYGDIKAQSVMSKQTITPLGELWIKFSDDEKIEVHKYLQRNDKAEIVATEEEMTSRGFTPEQKEFVVLIRETDDYLFDLWNEKRLKLGVPKVPYRKGHLPGTFEGDYKSIVSIMAENEEGEEVKELIGLVTANNNASFAKRKKFISEKFPGAMFKDLPKKKLDGAPMAHNLFDVYTELIEHLGPTNPEIKTLQGVLQEFARYDENRYLGFHVHEMAKKGVWGSSGNAPWKKDIENANDMFDALVRYFQEGAAHHNMLEFMQEMDTLFLDPDVINQAPRTLTYLRELYQHVLRHNPVVQGEYSKFAQILKNIGSGTDKTIDAVLIGSDMTHWLGIGPSYVHKASGATRYAFATWAMGLGNIAFSFLQLAQVPMFAPQMTMIMRRELGIDFASGRASAAQGAVTLAKYMLHHMSNGKSDKFLGPLTDDKEGHLALTYAEDNNLINFTDLERALEHVISPTASKIDRIVNFNQRYAEVLTRPLVFLWFYNLNRTAGLPVPEALETAAHRTQFVMVPYDLRDRPMMYASLGLLGMAQGQLKTFMHSSTSSQWYYAKQIKKGDFRPAAYTFAISLFVQGQMGLIGMQDVDNLVRAYNTHRNDTNVGIKEIAYEHLPLWITKGPLSEWSGIDFSARLRSPGLIQYPLMESVIPPSFSWTADELGNLALLTLGRNHVHPIRNKDVEKGLLGIVPPVAKPFIEEAFGNKVYAKGTKPLKGYERTPFDSTVRKFGFRSMEETKYTESRYDVTSDKAIRDMSIKQIEIKLYDAYNTGTYTKEYIDKLEIEYLAKGGSMQNLMRIMRTLPPNTVDERILGKPSMKNPERFMDLNDLLEKRKDQR